MADNSLYLSSNVELSHADDAQEVTPLEVLVFFKKLVHPRGYISKQELKDLVCNWIDENIIKGIM